eukprot:2698713-Rhodomonas_salina.1
MALRLSCILSRAAYGKLVKEVSKAAKEESLSVSVAYHPVQAHRFGRRGPALCCCARMSQTQSAPACGARASAMLGVETACAGTRAGGGVCWQRLH